MAKRAKFKVGQVVAVHYTGHFYRVAEISQDSVGFIYHLNHETEYWTSERELRPLTKREAGR